MGLKYSGKLESGKTNVLEGFADSSLSLPRSQGCRMAAWLSCQMTVGSTCFNPTSCIKLRYPSASHANRYCSVRSAAAVESSVVVCLLEVKLMAALFMVMHLDRGSLAKTTRAMELRVMTVRNKIEDMKVVPLYLRTSEMVADIGTKALDPKLFAYLRDKLCGHWTGEE
jgi:hypothetical protein